MKPNRTRQRSVATRRRHLLHEARMTYQRLKRKKLVLPVHIWPDRSSDIVTLLAEYALKMHRYLTTQEQLAARADAPTEPETPKTV